MKNLAPNMVRQAIVGFEGWDIVENKLMKEFKFLNFPTAILFVNRLVDPSEEMDHHPSITINYNRVKVSLFTHDTGGITQKDIDLLGRIEALKS